MCFTYQSWLIKRVFISHVTQKSAEKNGTCCSLSRHSNVHTLMLFWCAGGELITRIIVYLIFSIDEQAWIFSEIDKPLNFNENMSTNTIFDVIF